MWSFIVYYMWIFPILNPVLTFSSFSITNYLWYCCFTTSRTDNNSSSSIDRYHVLEYLLVIIKSYCVLRYIKQPTFTQTAGGKERKRRRCQRDGLLDVRGVRFGPSCCVVSVNDFLNIIRGQLAASFSLKFIPWPSDQCLLFLSSSFSWKENFGKIYGQVHRALLHYSTLNFCLPVLHFFFFASLLFWALSWDLRLVQSNGAEIFFQDGAGVM